MSKNWAWPKDADDTPYEIDALTSELSVQLDILSSNVEDVATELTNIRKLLEQAIKEKS